MAKNKIKKFENSKGKILNKLVKKIAEKYDEATLSDEDKQSSFDLLGSGISLIHVYFKDLEAVKYSKEENFGLMELIGRLRDLLLGS